MKKKKMMKKTFAAMSLAMAMLFVSCSDDDNNIAISAIKIETSYHLELGATHKFEVQILPEDATEKAEFVWESSDLTVVSISNDGTVKAIKEGTVTITAKLASNNQVKASSQVSVSPEAVDPDMVITFEDNKLAALVLFYDKNQDGKLQVSEGLLIKELNLEGSNVSSMKGIEYLTELETLNCSKNNLTSLDVSKNVKLKKLKFNNNRIATIELNTLVSLESLDCGATHLQVVDVSKNPELKELKCPYNHGGMTKDSGITKIDVTNNPKLEVLNINYTNVSELDLSKNPKLKWIDFGLTSYTSSNTQPITKIDFSNNKELEYINCDARIRTYDMNGVLVEDRKGLSQIDVTMLPKLKSLNFLGNSIKDIDVSRNPELTYLNTSHNFLSKLDITKNTKIDTLVCEWNTLTKLDLSKNTELVYINCANNQIDGLDVSNTKLSYMLANDNKMTSIAMGTKTFETLGGNDKKPYLYMKLNNNLLTSIDLSKQINLAWIEMNDNKLAKLDVSACTNLGGLLCNNNEIAELKIENITRIWELHFEGNKVSGTLDLSKQINIGRLSAAKNAGLKEVKVWSSFNADATYYLGGVGSLPCFTKDVATKWVKL